MFEQRANQIDMTAQSELMASFEENLWSTVIFTIADFLRLPAQCSRQEM